MYERVLIPTDGSPGADAAARHGLSIAQQYSATVHALYAIGLPEDDWENAPTALKQAEDDFGAEVTGRIEEQASVLGLDVVTASRAGAPFPVILDYVEDYGIDLVAMGTKRHRRLDLDRYLLGSVTNRVLRTVPASTLTVRDDQTTDPSEGEDVGYETVLIASDGSEPATAAVERGLDLAGRYGATVHGLYVVDRRAYAGRPGYTWEEAKESWRRRGERVLADVERSGEATGVEIRTDIREGLPYRCILDYATEHDVDLVVVGRQGLTGWDRFLLGSVSERVVRAADVPVLTVRGTTE